MARFDHVVRVARALQKLQETRAGITVRALAQDLEVGERTAYRYIEALIREGYPLENEGGRLRLPRTAPGRLTAEEERQLRMLAMASYPLEGSPLLPRVEAIISRLGEHTPRQSDLFARLKVPLTTRGLLAIDYTAHESVLRTLLKAMEEQKTVRARYFTASRQEETERDLDPYHFHYDAGLETLYLIGYCHWRREVRIFAGHRFRAVMLTRRPFQRETTFDARTYLSGAFRIYRGRQATVVRLRFTPDLAPRITERTWHKSQKVRPMPGGGVELALTLDSLEEVLPFVLSHAASVEAVEPPELVTRVAAAHRAAALRYEKTRRPARRAGVPAVRARVGR